MFVAIMFYNPARFSQRPMVLLFIFLLLQCFTALARPTARQQLDSLLAVTRTAAFGEMDSKGKANTLCRIGSFYGGLRLDSGERYARRALDISEKSGYFYGQGACLAVIGRYYSPSGFDESLRNYFLSLAAFEKARSDSGIAWAYNDIGGIYFNMRKFREALGYFRRAEKKAESQSSKQALATYVHNVAETLGEMHDYQQAMVYEYRALTYYRRQGDSRKVGSSLRNIGSYEQASGHFEKALPLFFDALAHYKAGDTSAVYYWEDYAALLNDIGSCYLQIAVGGVASRPDSIPVALKKAELDTALHYLSIARSIVRQPNVVGLRTLHDLSDALAVAGRYREALLLHRQYVTRKDSYMSNDKLLKMAAHETAREAALKEKQVEINRLEQQRRRREQWLFVGGIVLLFIILLLVMHNYRQQRGVNRLNEKLLQQKDTLMKEIHHRVKNNLQVISTLLDLQLIDVNDDSARNAMTESASRVRSISLIHQHLYQRNDVAGIEFASFTGELFRHVAAVFRGGQQAVVLDLHVPPTELDIDTAVPLGLMLNELLSNSFKYAFGTGRPGTITIALTRDGEYYHLTYRDSGPGLPEDMRISDLKSLGIKLLRRLSKQLGGNFSYSTDDHIFTLVFKDITGRKSMD